MYTKIIKRGFLKNIRSSILSLNNVDFLSQTRASLGWRLRSSESSAYGGDGKTTVRVLNNEETHLNLVNTYSSKGFRLSNNLFVRGSILLFPTNLYSWNVQRGADITLDSLLLFDLIVPKVKIVIIGYGQHNELHDASLPMKLKKKGISCEMLPTPHAVTTYNYLVLDAVHVAGAFVPMKDDVKMDLRDYQAVKGLDVFKDLPYFPKEVQGRECISEIYEKKNATEKRDKKDKKTFDE